MEQLARWWPEHKAIYNVQESYGVNAESGPYMHDMPIPQRVMPPREQWIDFLGYKIASPIGVPAGPLLTSKWTHLAAQLGFDVVTYKTIRSHEYAGHGVPNCLFVNASDVAASMATGDEINHPIYSIAEEPKEMEKLAITNSFGMPSKSRQFLEEDIPRANSLLQPGQVMVVSVVGTPSHTGNKNEDYTNFLRDFTETAAFAKKCGAQIVEANFSCPNVVTGEGSIYTSVDSVKDIASALTSALGDTPLIIKVGNYKSEDLLRSVLKTAAECKVKSVCGINSVSMKVLDPSSKEPALGANRLVSGICGAPIRPAAIDFVKKAKKVVSEEQLGLTIVGCGGITTAAHFDEFLQAGATVATTATGFMWDPYLGLRYHQSKLQ